MDKIQSKSYLDLTLEMTRASKIPISRISQDTGLNAQWLRAVLRGDYADPGVNKIETLRKYIMHYTESLNGVSKSA